MIKSKLILRYIHYCKTRTYPAKFSQSYEVYSLPKHSIDLINKCVSSSFHTSVYLKNKNNELVKNVTKPKTTIEKSEYSQTEIEKEFRPHENVRQDFMDPYLDKIRYRKKYHNPLERTLGILKDDILEFFGKLKHNPIVSLRSKSNLNLGKPYEKHEIFPEHCDIVIIGGGLVGVSIAYHLQSRGKDGIRIVVVEKDLSYSKASSALSVGGIRQQFSNPENIILSKYGMDFLQTAPFLLKLEGQDPPDFGINFHGYLSLATEEGMVQLIENYNLQKEYGSYVKLLSKKQLQEQYPWLEVDGIGGGVIGTQREGWFDPWSLLLAMAKKTKEFGTHYVQGDVYGCNLQELGDYVYEENLPTSFKKICNLKVRMIDGEEREINCAGCILAAGAWSQEVGKKLGVGTALSGIRAIPIPVEPRKRYVYCVHSPDGPGLSCPMVIDPDGTYFRREGLANLYLCGKSPEEGDEPPNEDLVVDHSFFENVVWPKMAYRCKGFNKLKVHSSWAGYYDYNTFDQNAIIGKHPLYSNLFIATGFSGHGVQQAAGAGKAISELVLDAEYKTLNVEKLGFERLITNEPILERCLY